MIRPVLGAVARGLDDLVSAHFDVGELTDKRGWWSEDVEGEALRYERLARLSLEPARAILGVPMAGISGARPLGHNTSGRPSSLHLPPEQRMVAPMRYARRPVAERGAALDFVPQGLSCVAAFWLLDEAMRAGRLPPGGLFWYGPRQGEKYNSDPLTGRFIHVDNRGDLARERALTPRRRVP